MPYYNEKRRHSSIDNQRPIDIFEMGKRKTNSSPKKTYSMNCKGQDEWSAAGATQTSLDKS